MISFLESIHIHIHIGIIINTKLMLATEPDAAEAGICFVLSAFFNRCLTVLGFTLTLTQDCLDGSFDHLLTSINFMEWEVEEWKPSKTMS